MWHRELQARDTSSSSRLNFLWQQDGKPVYVMDNHLGALWCWLREVKRDDAYHLFHIDWHWDCAHMLKEFHLLEELDAAGNVALDMLTSLEFVDAGRTIKLVRWDNYIEPFARLRPNLVEAHLVAHQSAETSFRDMPEAFLPYSLETFCDDFPGLLSAIQGEQIIINLDLDFFFLSYGRQTIQAFSDEFIQVMLDLIRAAVSKGAILTIALSPECCGGWEPAEQLCDRVCEQLGLDFKLPPDR